MIRLLTLPAGYGRSKMAISSGMSYRKSDQHTGKRNTKGVSENR